MTKTTTFTTRHEDPKQLPGLFRFTFWRDRSGWWLSDYEGCVRWVGFNWFEAVPCINLILGNHGMVRRVS